MKTRSVPSTFISARVPPLPRQLLASTSALTWPPKLLCAAWPISIPINNEELHDETSENYHAKTIRHCAHHHASSAPADVRHGRGLHAPCDRRPKTLRHEQRAKQSLLWCRIGYGEAHCGLGLALWHDLCPLRSTS